MSAALLASGGLGSLVALIFLRVPVAVALALVGFVGYGLAEGWSRAGLVLGAAPIELASAYTLSVVPLFALMGAVAAAAGLSSDLFRAANATLRGTRGSLSVASVFASAMFGAICGSSVATALTMTRVSVPEMIDAGYPAPLAVGAVAAGGTLGILIPPSLILMIYAIIAQLSVAQLFAAALAPGLILTVFYAVTAVILSRRALPARARTKAAGAAPPAILPSLARIWHVTVLFVLTIGGIYAGAFTPTEAAAVGAAGTILLGLVTRRTSLSNLYGTLLDTVRLVSAVIFIVMASSVFSYFIVQTGMSPRITGAMEAAGLGPYAIITLICVLFIVMGCFLEGIAMILIAVPIVLPMILSLGFDPIWFGVLLVVLIEIGLITPPLGMNLFVIKAVMPSIALRDIYRGTLPFLIAPLITIAVLIMFPGVALWLPSYLN